MTRSAGSPHVSNAASIYAVWHDPSSYDHQMMGPPYLPDSSVSRPQGRPKQASDIAETRQRVIKTAADPALLATWSELLFDYNQEPCSELAVVLSYLRAVGFVHQTHHWQSQGTSAFQDHLLYERIYNDTLPLIDSLAERAVGLGSNTLVNPVIQATHQLRAIQDLYSGAPVVANAEERVLLSLKSTISFLAFLHLATQSLSAKGRLSDGTANLLQGIADKSEEFVYLLKQRSSVR